MKKNKLIAFMLLATLAIQPLAQAEVALEVEGLDQEESIELTPEVLQRVADDLKLESQNKDLDKESRKALEQASKMFEENAAPAKKLNFGQKLGRTLGKGAAWVTTTTSKPFVNAAGFLTGFFEKKEKNKDIVALYQFFLNHESDFDPLYEQANTPVEFAKLLVEKSEEVYDKQTDLILRDFVKYLDPTIKVANDKKCDLSELDLSGVDKQKLTPDYINNHPSFKELKPIIGELSQEDLDVVLETGYLDKKLSIDNYKSGAPKIYEGIGALAAQLFVPKMVLGVISKSLASLYFTPVVLADLGTLASGLICSSESTKEKFKDDKDLGQFCSYVVNKSGYELLKSRAKGYVAGKDLKIKLKKKLDDRKARRAAKKAAKAKEQASKPM